MAKVPINSDNEKQCQCPNCPTWKANDCPKNKKEVLYCAKGKTVCQLPDLGCICGACPVFQEYGLEGGYFCFNGIAG